MICLAGGDAESTMTIRTSCRRSKNDEGKQQFSLFLTRTGLRQLLAEVKAGDVIVCRDQSRLGRDAVEVTLVIRDLVRDRGCRLFYYVTGQEVLFANAIDQATTFI